MERRGRAGKGISGRKWNRTERELEGNPKYDIGGKSKLEEGTSKALLREKRETQERRRRWWWKGGGGDDGPRAAILSTFWEAQSRAPQNRAAQTVAGVKVGSLRPRLSPLQEDAFPSHAHVRARPPLPPPKVGGSSLSLPALRRDLEISLPFSPIHPQPPPFSASCSLSISMVRRRRCSSSSSCLSQETGSRAARAVQVRLLQRGERGRRKREGEREKEE